MKNVGTAELKNHLSRYLRRVRTGERFVVTDHDEPVAELNPVRKNGATSLADRIAELARDGSITCDLALSPLKPRRGLAIRGNRASKCIRIMRDE